MNKYKEICKKINNLFRNEDIAKGFFIGAWAATIFDMIINWVVF
jgi:hypothetical protein